MHLIHLIGLILCPYYHTIEDPFMLIGFVLQLHSVRQNINNGLNNRMVCIREYFLRNWHGLSITRYEILREI